MTLEYGAEPAADEEVVATEARGVECGLAGADDDGSCA